MKTNVGNTDRLIRFVLAIAFFVLAFGVASGIWAYIAAALGVIMLLTAAIGFCPLYALFGLNTRPLQRKT